MDESREALKGVIVLNANHLAIEPQCRMVLADLSGNVIKVFGKTFRNWEVSAPAWVTPNEKAHRVKVRRG